MLQMQKIYIILFILCLPSVVFSNEQFKNIIATYQSKHLLNADILIVKGEYTLFHQQYGFCNRETKETFTDDNQFPIASISKQFTATAILLLKEMKKLDLDAPILQYLPANHSIWQGDVPQWAHTVTVHQLLTHSSGIYDYSDEKFDNVDSINDEALLAQLITKIKHKPLRFNSGEKFDYCNTGYLLLSEIVNQVSEEKSLALFLKKYIFSPLQMTKTYLPTFSEERELMGLINQIKDTPIRYIANLEDVKSTPIRMDKIHLNVPLEGGGAIISTITDLLKWNHGLYHEKILSKESLLLMTTPHIVFDHPFFGDIKYGYGIFIEDKDPIHVIYKHGGWLQGVRTDLSFCPASDTSVICLSNLSPDENQDDNSIRSQVLAFNDFALKLHQAAVLVK